MLPRSALFVSLVLACALASPAQEPTYTLPESKDCLGEPNAPIVMEVFSDYTCAACGQYFLQTLRPLIAEYVTVGKVCLIYRDLPFRNHPYSRSATLLAFAAETIGQKLEVATALFNSQAEWAQNGEIEKVVARALPQKAMARLRQALKDPKLDASIERQLARARQLGVHLTPTSFITAGGQTQRVIGAVQYPILKRFLDHLLGQ